jgi:hypothetical protein
MEDKIRSIIKEQVKKLKEEYQDKYKMVGQLITNLKVRPQKEILSDIRAIEGVTIVSSKETLDYHYQNPQSFKAILTVKVDGYPFIKSGGFNRDKMSVIADQIKKVDGVVSFQINPDNISAL